MASPTIKDRVADAATRISTRPSDAQIDRRLESLSRWMDSQFRIPVIGWRFGLNPIIDLIPVAGAVATTLVAIYVMISGIRYRVSRITLLRMALNIAIYFLVGIIPWVGNLFDAWWKPNIRNIALLRARATVHGAEAAQGRTSDWMFVGAIVCALLTLLFVSVVITFMALVIVIRTIVILPVQ
jgi:hypothetical protein